MINPLQIIKQHSFKLYLTLFISTVMTLFLSACSSTTNVNCQEPNWFERGRVMGQRGQNLKKIKSENFYFCKVKNRQQNYTLYVNGYNEGLLNYCTPSHFYNLGYSQSPLQQRVCPQDVHKQLEVQYRLGVKKSSPDKQTIQ